MTPGVYEVDYRTILTRGIHTMLNRLEANRYELKAPISSKLIKKLEEHPFYINPLDSAIFSGSGETMAFYNWIRSHTWIEHLGDLALLQIKFNRRSAEVCSSILHSLDFKANEADKFVTLLKSFELDYLNRSALRQIAFHQMIKRGEL